MAFCFHFMRYCYTKPEHFVVSYGETYHCNHPVYNECTLFTIGEKGLAVIQQRYDCTTKNTWWSSIDPWLHNEIYLHPLFKNYFNSRAKTPVDGLYPTVTIRQLMWSLKIKPIKRERWETYFDRKEV